MFNPQEQEEIDYQMGSASELQNAFAWNSMNRRPDDSGKIADAVAAGKFVVVCEGTEYCPSTDAVMGSRKVLGSVHDTREAALAELANHDSCDDVDYYVLPRAVKPALQPRDSQPIGDDELPF